MTSPTHLMRVACALLLLGVGLAALPGVADERRSTLPDVAGGEAEATPWVLDAEAAQRLVSEVLAEGAERVRVHVGGVELAFRVIAEDGVLILQPEDPVNSARLDNVVLRYQRLAEHDDVPLLQGIISTYGGTFIVSETYAADGSYKGGVVAAVDGSLVTEWQPGDDLRTDYGQLLVAANRAMGEAPGVITPTVPGAEPVDGEPQLAVAQPRGWVITHAEASEFVQQLESGGTDGSGLLELTLDGHRVEFMAFVDEATIALTPIDPFNDARIDGVVIELWVEPGGEPPPVQTLLSTYSGTIVISERYRPEGSFEEGVAARIDGELIRQWRPEDQYTVSLDDLLFMSGNPSRDLADAQLEDEVIRGGAAPTPVSGLTGGGIDEGAVNDGQTNVISDTGGI